MKAVSWGERTLGREESLLLLLGPSNRSEFTSVLASFQQILQRFTFLKIKKISPSDIINNLAPSLKNSEEIPCAAFFFESYPGEYSSDQINGLRKIYPILPLILIASPLCEGEGRTGKIPPGMIRYYIHQWETEGQSEFYRFLKEGKGRFALPQTANDEDYYRLEWGKGDFNAYLKRPVLNDLLPLTTFQPQGEMIPETFVICPVDSELRRLLLELAASTRQSACSGTVQELMDRRQNESFYPKRIILDLDPLPRERFRTLLEKILSQFPSVSFDCLATSPRQEELALPHLFPNLRFFPKPFDIRSLFPH